MNPYELHPEDREKMKDKKTEASITVKEVKEIISNRMTLIKNENSPLWGYNAEHISSFLQDIMKEIEISAGEKNDS